jgi:hypothetical protein
VRAFDDRYEEDYSKHHLAEWMIAYGARTGTVVRWTGLSRYRVQALSRRYHQRHGDTSRRGISPYQLAFVGASQELESEALALALIGFELKAIPEDPLPHPKRNLPDPRRGWRLMRAYELYRALVPDPHISLERAILLIQEFAEEKNLILRRCRTCGDAMVVERVGTQHADCPFCRRGGAPTPEKILNEA